MSNPLDGRLSMDTFDGLLNTTQAAVEAMCNGDLSPRETDILLKAVTTARGVIEAKKKTMPSEAKNPVAAPAKLDSSGPFGVFGVVQGGTK
mgnify:FL=1|tara:strand:- start:24820 stop:25092 length:273 start_codon:yes stop_codon:yes gene_type:complete